MPSALPSLAFLLRGRDTSEDEAGEHTIRKERARFEREGCSHFQVGPHHRVKSMAHSREASFQKKHRAKPPCEPARVDMAKGGLESFLLCQLGAQG